MSHGILENDSVVVAKEKAWHGLEIVLPDVFTADEAVRCAKLDWTVEKYPIQAIDPTTGDKYDIADNYATMRINADGKRIPLGVVGERYTPLQNVESFDFFDAIVGEGQAIYESAGSLFNGRKVWLLAKLPNDIIVGNDDRIEQYLLLSNSHDGSKSVECMFTPVRVVCNNTLTGALSSGKGIKIRHTQSVHLKVQEAHRLLGIVAKQTEATTELFTAMNDLIVDPVEIAEILKAIVPDGKGENTTRTQNIRGEMAKLIHNGTGVELCKENSLWRIYNGITEYISHIRTVKGLDKDASYKMEAVLFGSGASLNDKALEVMKDRLALAV